MYTKGRALLKVCCGESHWRAELEVEVLEIIRRWEWLDRIMFRAWPKTGLGVDGVRLKVIGVRVVGSRTEVIERDRVSRVKGPVWGVGREMRLEVRMVDEGKSK